VRITHPFHPDYGAAIELAQMQPYRGNRLFYHAPKGQLVTIPIAWTTLADPDPSVALADGSSPFRLADLLELVDLLAVLSQSTGEGVK